MFKMIGFSIYCCIVFKELYIKNISLVKVLGSCGYGYFTKSDI